MSQSACELCEAWVSPKTWRPGLQVGWQSTHTALAAETSNICDIIKQNPHHCWTRSTFNEMHKLNILRGQPAGSDNCIFAMLSSSSSHPSSSQYACPSLSTIHHPVLLKRFKYHPDGWKKSSHIINIWVMVLKVVLLCATHQVSSHGPSFRFQGLV